MGEREWNQLTASQQQSVIMMIAAFSAGTKAFFGDTSKAELEGFFDQHSDTLDMMIRLKKLSRKAAATQPKETGQ